MMPESTQVGGGQTRDGSGGGPMRRWQTLEHYYQAQKFAGSWACSFAELCFDEAFTVSRKKLGIELRGGGCLKGDVVVRF